MYVEDDEISRQYGEALIRRLFKIFYVAKDGIDAYTLYKKYKPSVIITDICMPYLNGIDLVKKIRQEDLHTHIIITSAHDDKHYLYEAANLQIDGYLIKPFTLASLVATIEKGIDRLQSLPTSSEILLYEGIMFDKTKRELNRNGRITSLGEKESELLSLLFDNQGSVVTKEQIAKVVWKHEEMTADAYRNLVNKLRTKLGNVPLETYRNIGLSLNI